MSGSFLDIVDQESVSSAHVLSVKTDTFLSLISLWTVESPQSSDVIQHRTPTFELKSFQSNLSNAKRFSDAASSLCVR